MQLVIVFQNFEMTDFCVASGCLPFQMKQRNVALKAEMILVTLLSTSSLSSVVADV